MTTGTNQRKRMVLAPKLGAILGLSCLTLATLMLGQRPAQAQVGLSPLVIEAEAERGQTQGVINVRNTSNQEFRARVYAEPFTYDPETGFQILPEESPSNLAPYLQFSPRELVIPPGVTRRVRFVVRFPPSLEDREYRAVLFTESLEETTVSSGGVNVGVTARIGATVYVCKGAFAPELTVESASWNPALNQPQILVANRGGASARPTADWTLRQAGVTVATGNIPPSGVIAGSERQLTLEISEELSLAAGAYQLTGKLIWNEENSQPFSIELIIPNRTTAAQ